MSPPKEITAQIYVGYHVDDIIMLVSVDAINFQKQLDSVDIMARRVGLID
jgi:hypothetical protein